MLRGLAKMGGMLEVGEKDSSDALDGNRGVLG